jgi:hypothetical protein
MPWTCSLVENPPLNEHGNVKWRDLPIGAMVYLDLPEEELRQRHLSDQYWAQNAQHRKPLVVKLPNGYTFLVDSQCWENGRHYGGWTVTGTPPHITVQPSINMVGLYHGWLQSGVLSDDVDGRKFA